MIPEMKGLLTKPAMKVILSSSRSESWMVVLTEWLRGMMCQQY